MLAMYLSVLVPDVEGQCCGTLAAAVTCVCGEKVPVAVGLGVGPGVYVCECNV